MFSVEEYTVILRWMGLLSVITFFASLIIIPWIIIRLPRDYFNRPGHGSDRFSHPVLMQAWRIVRNVAGIMFILAGIAMLLLPGQGIITIVIGISFMNFPMKNHLRDRLVRRPGVKKVLNWIRRKNRKPPFDL